MTMEKTGVDEESLLQGLVNEESQLMTKISRHMSSQEKTAEAEQAASRDEQRLVQVRNRIQELDTGRNGGVK